jgi:hypothetical protein
MPNKSSLETGVPPPFDQFKTMVENAALVDSLHGIRQSALLRASGDAAWIPHLEFVERFMRERGISLTGVNPAQHPKTLSS